MPKTVSARTLKMEAPSDDDGPRPKRMAVAADTNADEYYSPASPTAASIEMDVKTEDRFTDDSSDASRGNAAHLNKPIKIEPALGSETCQIASCSENQFVFDKPVRLRAESDDSDDSDEPSMSQERLQRLERLKKQLKEGMCSEDRLKSKVIFLEKENSALKRTNAELVGEVVAFRRERAELRASHHKTARNDELARRNLTLTREVSALRRENAALDKDIITVSNEKSALAKRSNSLMKENLTLTAEVGALEKENAGLKREKATLAREPLAVENRALSAKIVELTRKMAALAAENAALMKEVDTAAKEAIAGKKESAALKVNLISLQ